MVRKCTREILKAARNVSNVKINLDASICRQEKKSNAYQKNIFINSWLNAIYIIIINIEFLKDPIKVA